MQTEEDSRQMSATRRSKAGWRDWEAWMRWGRRWGGAEAVFSMKGGRPWSELLKGRGVRRMLVVDGRADLRFWMLRGVVIKEMHMVWFVLFSRSLAKARKGMKWPCAMRGSRRTCTLVLC